ncbi:hypothetical protein, partial [Pseudoflavonifractor phocaeensis]|uniref:hypothetical protein n=1 Tax=Pseudoflavonifractor phocaeensis TaxID=1870988 RepID=UPI00195B4EEF
FKGSPDNSPAVAFLLPIVLAPNLGRSFRILSDCKVRSLHNCELFEKASTQSLAYFKCSLSNKDLGCSLRLENSF